MNSHSEYTKVMLEGVEKLYGAYREFVGESAHRLKGSQLSPEAALIPIFGLADLIIRSLEEFGLERWFIQEALEREMENLTKVVSE